MAPRYSAEIDSLGNEVQLVPQDDCPHGDYFALAVAAILDSDDLAFFS
jgi:hypothetical protein